MAFSQSQIKLDFGSEGDREIWVSDKLSMPASTMKATAATLVVPRQGGATDKMFVWDRKSGNVAAKAIPSIKDSWKVSPADFKWIGKLTLRVQHDGKQVKTAIVDLKDSSGSRTFLIDPASKGDAQFFGVPAGNADVTVQYTSNGAQAEPVTQKVTLELARPEPDPVFTIALSQPVETLADDEPNPGAKPSSNSSQAPPVATAPKGSIIGNILVYLLGIAAATALIYFGLKYIKQNEDKVKDQLQKVGVQIPEPAEPDPAPAAIPVAPSPPQKILLDDADPSVPTAATIAAPIAVSQPSLVMANGDVFPLAEGETTIGREAGSGLSLVTESTVSRRHATVERTGNDVTLRDDGSSNGTFVNGVKIESETSLRPGDQIQFGEVKVRFES
jgi:hypothetical protein